MARWWPTNICAKNETAAAQCPSSKLCQPGRQSPICNGVSSLSYARARWDSIDHCLLLDAVQKRHNGLPNVILWPELAFQSREATAPPREAETTTAIFSGVDRNDTTFGVFRIPTAWLMEAEKYKSPSPQSCSVNQFSGSWAFDYAPSAGTNLRLVSGRN